MHRGGAARDRGGRRQVLAPDVAAGQDRVVYQRVERHRLVVHHRTLLRGHVEAAEGGPAGGIGDGHVERQVPGEVSGRVERDLVGFQAEHGRRHHHAALVRHHRRQVLEVEVERGGALRHRNVEGEDVDRVAHPGQAGVAGVDHQAAELVDLPGRRMVARYPFGEQQHGVAGLADRDGLVRGEDVAVEVGGVDPERDGAGKGVVHRRLDRRHRRGRLRLRRVLGQRAGRSGCGEEACGQGGPGDAAQQAAAVAGNGGPDDHVAGSLSVRLHHATKRIMLQQPGTSSRQGWRAVRRQASRHRTGQGWIGMIEKHDDTAAPGSVSRRGVLQGGAASAIAVAATGGWVRGGRRAAGGGGGGAVPGAAAGGDGTGAGDGERRGARADAGRAHHAAGHAARAPAPHRVEEGLRPRAVRRLHGDRGRAAHQQLPEPGGDERRPGT